MDVFDRIEDMLAFDGFHPFNYADFTLRLHIAGLGLGNLPSFSLPSVASFIPNTLTLVLVCVLLAGALMVTYQIGLLDPLFTSTVKSLELLTVMTVISFSVTVASMLFAVADELKLYGYQATVELATNAWLYAIVVGLLVLALFAWISEASMRDESVDNIKLTAATSKPAVVYVRIQ